MNMQAEEPTSKEKILLAARNLFGEYGYADTTFKRIAEKSGMALGLITHYFGSKEKLFVSSSLSVLDELYGELQEAASSASNGLEEVLAFVEAYLNYSVTPGKDFLLLVRCSPYSDIKSDINKDDVSKMFERLILDISEMLARGMEDGSVVDCPSVKTANCIFATVVGSVRTRLLSPYCPDNYYEEVLHYVRRSIAK
ncbi:TetR/AcrR family transcriptional regulator [Desulfohalovibrio reitneri]|uniref:TetR/AcrR family transcriptional regulator n=1 Tax=Desulfohalovibrio reitneri TaxID=1307759 RepID=UPI0004A73368|nr:TetR/AcrR family transcriptional regulator [Desulfohalovibrio reitneri]